MAGPTRQARGFTLVELLAVVAVIAILLGLLLVALWKARIHTKISAAHAAVEQLQIVLEEYRTDFKAYPPDTIPASPGATGSQVLTWYLGRRFTIGDWHPGPYVEGAKLRASATPGLLQLPTAFGRSYTYALLRDPNGAVRGYCLVDNGPDSFPGGHVDPLTGFVPDGSDGNGDGVPDDQDNIPGGGP